MFGINLLNLRNWYGPESDRKANVQESIIAVLISVRNTNYPVPNLMTSHPKLGSVQNPIMRKSFSHHCLQCFQGSVDHVVCGYIYICGNIGYQGQGRFVLV